MTTHVFDSASDWTIADTEYLKQSGDTVTTRNLGDFSTSDLSAWCPLSVGSKKSDWVCARAYPTSTTYQPKAGDAPADGSGYLALVVTNVANAGWYTFYRRIPAVYVGTGTTQSANGLYLDIDYEVDSVSQANQIGVINPRFGLGAVPPSFSLHSSQHQLLGYEDDGTGVTGSTSGSTLSTGTKYYARLSFTTNSLVFKNYASAANRAADASALRSSTAGSIDYCTVDAFGAFVRYNTAGSVLKIYATSGTICDWYGVNKIVTFNAVDFGATPERIRWNTCAASVTGNVKFAYRVQATDGVWGDWSCTCTAEQMALLDDSDPVYALQIKAVFNDASGSSAATLTSFSVTSSATARTKYPAVGAVLDGTLYGWDTLTGTRDDCPTDKAVLGTEYGDPADPLVGTYTAGGVRPDAPGIEVANDETGTSATVTLTGDEETYTHYVYYKKRSATAWTAGGSRTGDGGITVTGLTEDTYDFIAISKNVDNLYSVPSAEIHVRVTAGAGAEIIKAAKAVVADLNAQSWSVPITATRIYAERLAHGATETARLLVVPVDHQTKLLSREPGLDGRYVIDVALIQKTSDDDTRDDLMAVVDEIRVWAAGAKIDNYRVVAVEQKSLYDYARMIEDKVFLSAMTLTLRRAP